MLFVLSLTTHLAQGIEQSIPNTILLFLGLLLAMVILAVIAPRLHIPYPILLVLGGLLLGFIPGLPRITLNPDVMFFLFLPPLLYSSAWLTSWQDFRANLRPIGQLALILVLVTTVGVAVVVHFLIPGIPWAVAFVLGAIVSPTDAVAATAIAQQLGIPQRIVTILEGESLLNDATGLVAYRFAVAAVVSSVFSLGNASLQFVIVSAGGIIVGLLIGWALCYIHRAMNNPSLEITLTLITPYAVYLLCEEVLHVSGVLATVTTGLFLARRASVFFSSETRLQAYSVWSMIIFLFNGLVLILIGLQLPGILDIISKTTVQHAPLYLIWYAIAVSLTVILIRLLWIFPATLISRLSRRVRERDPYPGWRPVLLIGWTGMRGAVSLAAALALPEVTAQGTAFPERALVIYLTFSVILATLVVQGLSLPLLVRILNIHDNTGAVEQREEKARIAAAQAALTRLDELAEQDEVPTDLAQHLRKHYEARITSITKRIKKTDADDPDTGYTTTYQQLEQKALQAERSAMITMRNQGEINDEILRRMERELDLEEQRLAGEAIESI